MSDQHPPPHGAGTPQPPNPPTPPPGNGVPPPVGSPISPMTGTPVPPPPRDGMAHGPMAVSPGLPRGDNMYGVGVPPPPPGTSPTPTSRSGRGPVPALLALISALLLLCLIIGGILVSRGSAGFSNGAGDNGSGGSEITNATVGECLAGESAGKNFEEIQDAELRIVDCTDTEANLTVVGRIEGRSEEQADDEVCQPYDQAELTYWAGRSGESGTVLCLETS
jgi:hypothetical protein